MGAAAPAVQVTVTVTDSYEEETTAGFPGRNWRTWCAGGIIPKMSGLAGICSSPLFSRQPVAEELEKMETVDLLLETGRREPESALERVKLLLSTVEELKQNECLARQLFQSAYMGRL